MNSDKFSLSVGHAHQLEMAFRRNGWTLAEVEMLREGTVLGELREFLGPDGSIRPPEGFALVPIGDVALIEAAKRGEQASKEAVCREAYEQLRDKAIVEIFSERMTDEVGYSRMLRTKFLGILEEESIRSIADLVRLSKSELYRTHRVGRDMVAYTEAVLAAYNLQLGMS